MFRVGQKVVLVDDNWIVKPSDEIFPVAGVVYTIRAVGRGRSRDGILLAEIRNTPKEYSDGFQEANFLSRRFRPIVERKTDISVFEEILRRESAPSPLPLPEA